MIKKSFRLMLLAAFALSSVMFVSCNKWEDEINELDSKVAALEQTVSSLKAAVDGGAVISSVSNTSEGVKFTLSNGQSYTVNHGAVGATGAAGQDGKDGQDGKPGSVVTIGENGNWFIDGVDQNVSAVGASTFVVDCGSYFELNVVEKVDGENSEIVKIKLPKTANITSLKAIPAIGKDGKINTWGNEGIELVYGTKVDGTSSYKAADYTFNGKTYAKGSYLFAMSNKFSAFVNPSYTDASLYTFKLVDSKGNAPYVVGAASQNKTEGALTKADATPNAGVWDMTIGFPEGVSCDGTKDAVIARRGALYALAAETAEGLVMSEYEIKVTEKEATNVTFDGMPASASNATGYEYCEEIKDKGKRTIDLTKVILDDDNLVDYYFTLVNPTTDGAKGIALNGTTLTAPANFEGNVALNLYPLLVDCTTKFTSITAVSVTAVFEHVAASGAMDNISWTITDKTDKDQNIVYLPLGDLQASLKASADNLLPTVATVVLTDWTWADGTELTKKTEIRNGKEYGKNNTSNTVPYGSAMTANMFPEVSTALYYQKSNGSYDVAQGNVNIDKPLYVKFTFKAATAFPGDFKVKLGLRKNGENINAIEVPVAVSMVAPDMTIVKNAPYFNGDNAVVYGTPETNGAKFDLDDLFTTENLAYAITKVKYDTDGDGSLSDETAVDPWGNILTGNEVVVPFYDVNAKPAYNNTFNVGSTQTVTASLGLFGNPYIEEAEYVFTVTAKSPVVVSYSGAAKVINNEPIYIAVDEFTGKTLKTGAAIYLGTIDYADANATDRAFDSANIKTVSIEADPEDEYSKYISVKGTSFNSTVSYKDAEGKEIYNAQAVVVERVSGIALQSPVTCKVNVTVKDMWGVETVIPVNVTVNPIQ